jgi:hypothetical protein
MIQEVPAKSQGETIKYIDNYVRESRASRVQKIQHHGIAVAMAGTRLRLPLCAWGIIRQVQDKLTLHVCLLLLKRCGPGTWVS